MDYDGTNGGSGSVGSAGMGGFLPTPTPGGPLTADRVTSLGIVKMNAYLVTGTRQQFWEEYFVKVIMQVSALRFQTQWKTSHGILTVSFALQLMAKRRRSR